LLARKAVVIALEADVRAIEVLRKTFPKEIERGNLTIHHADIRSFDYGSLPELKDHGYKVVSNIPYYLSGMLFREILEAKVQPTDLVFLVQKEVAKRIVSDAERNEKESLLSLSVKVYGTPKYVKTVSRGHFAPAPNVDSA